MKKNYNWFSFVELIVSVAILAVISTIWFISYSSYLWDSRDSQRKSDLAQVWSALKVYKQKRWYYPDPWNDFSITHFWEEVAKQGKFDQWVRLNTLDKLPMDPKNQVPYQYSITRNGQEYEMVATLENEDSPIALLNGTYKTASINVLPSISLAISRETTQTAEIAIWQTDSEWVDWSENRNRFIFDSQDHNLAYTFEEPYNHKSDWTDLDTIITDLKTKNLFWQNTDFRNCAEIKESWKNLKPDNRSTQYQVIDSTTWDLRDENCIFN